MGVPPTGVHTLRTASSLPRSVVTLCRKLSHVFMDRRENTTSLPVNVGSPFLKNLSFFALSTSAVAIFLLVSNELVQVKLS